MKSRRKMKISAWAKREFTPESIPNTKTLRSWVDTGKVDGVVVDGRYYVYEDCSFGVSKVSKAVDQLIGLSKVA